MSGDVAIPGNDAHNQMKSKKRKRGHFRFDDAAIDSLPSLNHDEKSAVREAKDEAASHVSGASLDGRKSSATTRKSDAARPEVQSPMTATRRLDASRYTSRTRTKPDGHRNEAHYAPQRNNPNGIPQKDITNGRGGAYPPSIPTPKQPKQSSSTILPIASHRSSIITALRKSPVLILTGETGSGKSTRLPQYLLPSLSPSLRIAVTQPRRVAAITLARRVASELGSSLGRTSKHALVGYSVRFDRNVGHANKILFVTEGMLMMEMLGDPGLCNYEIVVVDEVHERGVEVDLLLGFLRELVCGRGNGAEERKKKGIAALKVVVMSATADVQSLTGFFEEGFQQQGDALASGEETTLSNDTQDHVAMVKVEGRQYPVEISYLPRPAQDYVEEALKCIFRVHCKEPMPGDVLVFLPGQETIQGLQRNIEEYAGSLGPEYPKLLVLPIYAALPQHLQSVVFDPAPRNTRKIILATNIAETSITIPAVRHVIDTGKEKRKQFRPSLGLESLLVKPISKSSAIQRKGRAGREAPGKCFRLYTQTAYDGLEENKAPEILRCDLADPLLRMKAAGVQDVLAFPLLTRPSKEAMARSLLGLYQLDALDDTGSITEVGRQLSRFPLPPAFARVVVAAAAGERAVVLEVIDVIAALTADGGVFPQPVSGGEEEREQLSEAREGLLRRQGDMMTLLATVRGYTAEHSDRKAWCVKRGVNHRAMQNVLDIRKQLRQLCISQGMVEKEEAGRYDGGDGGVESEEVADGVMKAFLRGFRGNVARLMPDGSYRTFVGGQNVAIHPASVLFGRKVEAFVYVEGVFTTRSYARGCGIVRADWIGEVLC